MEAFDAAGEAGLRLQHALHLHHRPLRARRLAAPTPDLDLHRRLASDPMQRQRGGGEISCLRAARSRSPVQLGRGPRAARLRPQSSCRFTGHRLPLLASLVVGHDATTTGLECPLLPIDCFLLFQISLGHIAAVMLGRHCGAAGCPIHRRLCLQSGGTRLVVGSAVQCYSPFCTAVRQQMC